jgi:hypothetical protein
MINLQAEYMCDLAPSLTEQYEYAHEHGIKWLVIITEAALSLQQTVKANPSAIFQLVFFLSQIWGF